MRMATPMEFGLLGPLIVRCDGSPVSVERGKQRAVLAVLLLNANQVVSVDRLAASLWGSAPPDSARVTVRNYIKRLRQALGEAGRERISTRSHGYLISADPDELDISRFEVLLESARAARRAGSWNLVSAYARTALSLWRGEPLTDMGSQELGRQLVPWLTEMRLQALEARLDADMHLGDHADVIPELRGLTQLNPLREHLHALLILALYRCGRQGEALAVYADVRQVLVDELGVEPGNELRDLHQRILTADPGLALSRPTGHQAGNDTVTTAGRDLPGAVRHFVGREQDLAALTEHITPGVRSQPALVISVIAGTAGVGKTALALQWAQQSDHCFPDGQLYINMRGYDPGEPVTAGDALARLLRSLGVADQDIPAETDDRSARFRSLMSGRKILLLLDNVSDVSQVRPLLPAAPGCATLVTSRDSLAGLVARDGAQRIDLDLLPLPDAIELLRALIGSRVDAEPDSATKLARQCARLPLTLRLAAELAAWRPSARLADLTAELQDQRRRLDLLDASGDSSTDIRAVFFWSYRQLDGAAARAFRMAGLQPGPSFDRYALAAMTGSTVEEAGQTLDVLARASLVRPSGSRGYGMHDLLSAYARELAAAYDGDHGQRLALTGLFDYYLHAAGAAMDAVFPAEAARRPRISKSSFPALPITDKRTALAWLDAERANLTAFAAHGAKRGWPEHVIGMAATLYRYFDAAGHFHEAMTIHAHARSAAALAGDRAGEATALANLAVVHIRQGRNRQAARYTQRALDLYREIGDRNGEARTLHNLAVLEHRQGQDKEAADDMRRAVNIYRQTGDRIGQIRGLSGLGSITMRQGCLRRSFECQEEALVLARAARDRTGEAYAHSYIGTLHLRLGCYGEADEHLARALALHRALRDRNGEAGTLNDLGDLHLRLGRWHQAGELIERALAIYRELGDRSGEAMTLNGLGEVQLAAGAPAKSRVQHMAALRLARGVADRYEQARSHCGLARSHDAEGDYATAACHWHDALVLYAELGTPEADQIRALLKRS
jgi:DNA-binding SARP family transcriptional activator/tetratricopeptide (TPR) repeat protein